MLDIFTKKYLESTFLNEIKKNCSHEKVLCSTAVSKNFIIITLICLQNQAKTKVHWPSNTIHWEIMRSLHSYYWKHIFKIIQVPNFARSVTESLISTDFYNKLFNTCLAAALSQVRHVVSHLFPIERFLVRPLSWSKWSDMATSKAACVWLTNKYYMYGDSDSETLCIFFSFVLFFLFFFLSLVYHCIVVGQSRKDCNTGPTRGESRASPGHLTSDQKSV